MADRLPHDRNLQTLSDEPRSFSIRRAVLNGDGPDEGWSSFKSGLRAWWPHITFILVLVFAVGALRADAAHSERRLLAIEAELPKMARELSGLNVHAEVTSKTLLRLEDKIDHLKVPK